MMIAQNGEFILFQLYNMEFVLWNYKMVLCSFLTAVPNYAPPKTATFNLSNQGRLSSNGRDLFGKRGKV